MNSDELDRLTRSLRAGEYNLLLGAAASLGSVNGNRQPLPLASGLVAELAALKNTRPSHSLQRLFQTLTDKEVETHITQRFSELRTWGSDESNPDFSLAQDFYS